MDLFSKFQIRLPEMITVVGAGGKTSLMFALAAEAARQSIKVATTTTTKIFYPDRKQSPRVVLFRDPSSLQVFNQARSPDCFLKNTADIADSSVSLEEIRAALMEKPHVTVALSRIPGGKLRGLPWETVDELFRSGAVSLVVVEGDGARGLPLKAPGREEPVIPRCTGLTIPVAGLGALNSLLGEDTVFRPEVFERITGLKPGQRIRPAHVAAVMTHPEGLTRGTPSEARIIPYLNQADLAGSQAAKETARAILTGGKGRIERVVWGSMKGPVPFVRSFP